MSDDSAGAETKLALGTAYTFKVVAQNSFGNSAGSGPTAAYKTTFVPAVQEMGNLSERRLSWRVRQLF